jgi:hypothetical protein
MCVMNDLSLLLSGFRRYRGARPLLRADVQQTKTSYIVKQKPYNNSFVSLQSSLIPTLPSQIYCIFVSIQLLPAANNLSVYVVPVILPLHTETVSRPLLRCTFLLIIHFYLDWHSSSALESFLFTLRPLQPLLIKLIILGELNLKLFLGVCKTTIARAEFFYLLFHALGVNSKSS